MEVIVASYMIVVIIFKRLYLLILSFTSLLKYILSDY